MRFWKSDRKATWLQPMRNEVVEALVAENGRSSLELCAALLKELCAREAIPDFHHEPVRGRGATPSRH